MAAIAPPRPLAENDDRCVFDCGRPALNSWFTRLAWQHHVSGVSRTNVVCDPDTGRILGYVTLGSAHVERAFVSQSGHRERLATIPVALIGRLAVDRDHHGHGHARSLLLFALRTVLAATPQITSLGVITHPFDAAVRAFFRRWGFEDVPFDPHHSMFLRTADLAKSGIE